MMNLQNIIFAVRNSYSHLSSFGRNCGLCKVQPKNCYAINQIATITGKAMRVDRPPRPPPYDYKNKRYNFWAVFTDSTEKRLDDNSKIVVIEGPPAVGKDKFARELADELEMLYVPTPEFDGLFINSYGFDYRTLNDRLPVDAQYFDDKMFLADPHNRNTTFMQHTYYVLRLEQYIDAITHIFATGQGVVLQRSPWSDMVFMRAMHNSGYVSNGGFDYYKSARGATLHYLLRPHLVIYLDIPSTTVKERIQQRALPHEINAKALTPKYLSDIENNYKNLYLPEISVHANVLIYNWKDGGDMSAIIDDIEELDFENDDRENPKMRDWYFNTYDLRRAARSLFANDKFLLMSKAYIARVDIPEMLISAEDVRKRDKLFTELAEEYPGFKFRDGFDPFLDKQVLLKTGGKPRDVNSLMFK